METSPPILPDKRKRKEMLEFDRLHGSSSAEKVTVTFSMENWSGTTTEEFIEMFAEQLNNAGNLQRFQYKVTTTKTVSGRLL